MYAPGMLLRRVSCLLVALGLPVVILPAQSTPKWLLVKSAAEPGARGARSLASFGWERLARSYFKRDYRVVTAAQANATAKATAAANRLVAGTQANNPLVQELCAQLGVTWKDDKVHYGGGSWPDDAGIALITDDPDGGGMLVLFAGKTEAAAYNCLSVPVDLGRSGVVVMTFRNELYRGKVGGAATKLLAVVPDAMRIVRLDRELFGIRRRYADSVDEAALRVSRAFAGYQTIFERCLSQGVDLFAFTRRQLVRDAKLLDATERRFAKVDIEGLLEDVDRQVTKALGKHPGPRPIVHVVVTGKGTNAQVIGKDPKTGRVRMTLNLAMFESVAELRLAATHEFVHTLQRGGGDTLVDQAIREGVASYLSQRLVKGTKDHEALMWTEVKVAAATKRRKAILREFDRLRGSRDPRQIGKFLYAGTELRGVAGAPDRCGYWVGWLAVKAYCAKHPKKPLGDLLTADAAAIHAALTDG